ncbi:MAG: NAD(P)/FAD-dependent oxidoreductase [Nitrospirae bacterium]|nr:NAD(P)/FAD-dependent oxidoreductase [Candidatus Manganitrophaceae bacterium]
MERYSLLVLGAGSAGLYGALKAAELGARVALVEGADLGGTCPNRGCLPTKHLVTAAERYYYGQLRSFRGVKPRRSRLNFTALMSEKNAVVQYAREEKERMVSDHPNITLIRGRGRLISGEAVDVNGTVLSAEKILLATGSSPILPPIPGLAERGPLNSDRVQSLTRRPQRLIVIGGGEIGLEYGQLFLHLGTEVVLLEKEDRILPREEPEISAALRRYLEEEGMEIHTGVEPEQVESLPNRRGHRVTARKGMERVAFESPALFVAIGRRPNTDSLGWEKIGLKRTENDGIETTPYFQTSIPTLFAAGDIRGHRRMLASIADREGELAAENALTGSRHTMEYLGIAYAILTSPQVASVGLKEAEARAAGHAVKQVDLSLPEELPKATADRGWVKLVVEEGSHRILGVHLLAAKAAEAIHEAIFIVKSKLTVEEVCRTVHVYPTVAEAILRAAEAYPMVV